MKLKNKTVLITGAARGIGQKTAVELALAGADIIGVDLRYDDLNETAKLVEKAGKKFTGCECDISDEKAVEVMSESAITQGFDVLVNNAGVLPSGPFLTKEFEVWRRTIEINLLGLMSVAYKILPYFLEKNAGHIVNIASIAGKFGTEGVAAYSASKHGVVGFSSALRSELEGKNVSVSWICPSPARTRLADKVSHTFWTPLVEAEDVAQAVRKAIEKNKIEVFVPARVRLVTSVLPSLMPRFARWLLRVTKASRGWTVANQDIQV